MPNGDRGSFRLLRSKTSPTGWSLIANSGPRASIGWTSICTNCKAANYKPRRKNMLANTLKNDVFTKPTEREIVITRVFDAPRALVFKMWTDAKHFREWFGPGVFTNPVCEVDARVGGKWRVVMRANSRADYPCGGGFL